MMMRALVRLIGGFVIGDFKKRAREPYAKLIGFILIGTVPATIVGFTLKDWIEANFRDSLLVGMAMFLMGVIFIAGEAAFRWKREGIGLVERAREKVDEVRDVVQPGGYEPDELRGMKWWRALIIGCAQAFALIPGISRSGSTIVAGLFQGIKRDAAARFSFLLGIPAIGGAALLTIVDFAAGNGSASLPLAVLIVGFVTAFFFGLGSVWFLMRFLKKHSLVVFSVYLIALGLLTFV